MLAQPTCSSSSPVYPFVPVKLRRSSDRLWEHGQGFVSFLSVMVFHFLHLSIKFLRQYYRDKIFQTMYMSFLINVFVFLWWAVLAHQEVTGAHKQKQVCEEGGRPVIPAEGSGH